MAIRLGDGSSVAIRPIRAADLDPLRAFFGSLTPATRRLRFHVSVKELPESLLQDFTSVDHRSHAAFVAESHEGARRATALVAEARYVRQAGTDAAEVAFVVAEGWRRLGLGTSLAHRLIRRARLAGVRRLFGDVLADNEQALRFLCSLGAQAIRAQDAGTVRLWLEL
jgi:GNAT superfamily N-acetyltransferase